MIQLPKHWERLPTNTLDEYLTTHGDKLAEHDVDSIIEELAKRDAQEAANRGAMNGLAPEY